VFWLYSGVVAERQFAVIARLRAEIENGDARSDSPLATKSEVGKVMADLYGPAETQTKSAGEFRNKGMHPFIRFVDSELARAEKTQGNPVGRHPNRKQPDPWPVPPPIPSTRWLAFATRFATNPSPKSLLPHSSTSSDLEQHVLVVSDLSAELKPWSPRWIPCSPR
jgi:hypothetical protein